MKKVFVFVLALSFTGMHAQDYNADNVENVLGEKSKKKTSDRILALNSNEILAATVSEKRRFIRKIDPESMNTIWLEKLPKNFKHNKLIYDTDTVMMAPDGVVNILCSSFDRRKREVTVAIAQYKNDGSFGRFFEIARAPANTEYEYEVYHMASTEKYFIVSVFTGIEERTNKLVHLYWFDHNFKEVKSLTTEMLENSYELESCFYDEERDVIVFSSFFTPRKMVVPIMSPQVSGTLQLSFNQKDYVIYRASITDEIFKSYKLDTEGVKLYSNEIVLDKKNGTPYLFGLSGPEKSKRIDNIYAYELDSKTLEIKNASDLPISERLVQEIKDAKYGWIKVMKYNTVNFVFSNAVFTENGIYAVYDDVNGNDKYGQLIVHLNSDLKLNWYTYFHSFGRGTSYSRADKDGNLILYNIVYSSIFQKQHEHEDIIEDYPKINFKASFVETKFTPKQISSSKMLSTFYYSQMKTPLIFLDAVFTEKDKINFYITNGLSLNSSQEKRQFRRITVHNPDF